MMMAPPNHHRVRFRLLQPESFFQNVMALMNGISLAYTLIAAIPKLHLIDRPIDQLIIHAQRCSIAEIPRFAL